MIYITEYISPLGKIFLESEDGKYLTGLSFSSDKNGEGFKKHDLEIFVRVKSWLDKYFKGENPVIEEIPLKLNGTIFRQIIWEYLIEIPYGQTVTYGELAKMAAQKLGKSIMSAQAVGNAVKNNPVAIIVPCHRVVAKNSIGGYNFGVEKKISLLKLEKIIIS